MIPRNRLRKLIFQQENSPFFLSVCVCLCACGFKSHLNIYRNIMLEIVLIEAETLMGLVKGEDTPYLS